MYQSLLRKTAVWAVGTWYHHTRIYPQTSHPTLAPMTEHGHQNLSLMNEKLKFLHIYTRCFLDGIIPIQNNSTPFSSILNYETLNHKPVKERDL